MTPGHRDRRAFVCFDYISSTLVVRILKRVTVGFKLITLGIYIINTYLENGRAEVARFYTGNANVEGCDLVGQAVAVAFERPLRCAEHAQARRAQMRRDARLYDDVAAAGRGWWRGWGRRAVAGW